MVLLYIGKKIYVYQITREQAQTCSTNKWTKLEYVILFCDVLKLGSCLK